MIAMSKEKPLTAKRKDRPVSATPTPAIDGNSLLSRNQNFTGKTWWDYRNLERLEYKIVGCSSYSPTYGPEHIKHDCPEDQGSRWSTISNDQNQFLTVRFEGGKYGPSLLRTITFGKFAKTHVCNLKEFFVEIGLDDTNVATQTNRLTISSGVGNDGRCVLHAGLRNDAEPETFTFEDWPLAPLATWMRIRPTASWGGSFNYSIWYVEVRGHGPQDPSTLAQLQRYFEAQERLSMREALKWSRIRRSQCDVGGKKGDLAAELYRVIVLEGNFAQAQRLLADNPVYLDDFLRAAAREQPQTAQWTPIKAIDGNGNNNNSVQTSIIASPSPRGGHQMVADVRNGRLYLFGGFNGTHDLGDLWQCSLTARGTSTIGFPTIRFKFSFFSKCVRR